MFACTLSKCVTSLIVSNSGSSSNDMVFVFYFCFTLASNFSKHRKLIEPAYFGQFYFLSCLIIFLFQDLTKPTITDLIIANFEASVNTILR